MRQINFAHSARADWLFDFICAEFLADERENFGAVLRQFPRHHIHRRIFHKPLGFLLRVEQTQNFALQIIVAIAFRRQKIFAPFVRNFQNGIEKLVNLFPAFGVHKLGD